MAFAEPFDNATALAPGSIRKRLKAEWVLAKGRDENGKDHRYFIKVGLWTEADKPYPDHSPIKAVDTWNRWDDPNLVCIIL